MDGQNFTSHRESGPYHRSNPPVVFLCDLGLYLYVRTEVRDRHPEYLGSVMRAEGLDGLLEKLRQKLAALSSDQGT